MIIVRTDDLLAGAPELAPLGTVRLQPLPVLLGTAPAPGLHLDGPPIAYALTGAKADERQTLLGMLQAEPDLVAERPGQTLIADKHHYGRDFEHAVQSAGIIPLRQARTGEPSRSGARLFKPLRQTIESINQPLTASSTWNATAGAHRPASSSASCNASLP